MQFWIKGSFLILAIRLNLETMQLFFKKPGYKPFFIVNWFGRNYVQKLQ